MNHLVSLMTIRAEKQACLVSHLRYWALLLLTVGLLQATTVQAQTISTIAGNGSIFYNDEDENGTNDYATAVSLASPRKAAIDASGNLYIADSSHNRIRRVDKNGIITTVAGNGAAGYSGDNGAATSASLNYPTSVAIDSKNNLYIADNQNHRIRKVTGTSPFTITTVAGTGVAGYNGDNIAATTAQLNTPVSVAIDSNGTTLYITDKNNQRIRKVTGTTISTVAGNGAAGYSDEDEDAPATNASLNFPFDVAVDTSGNLYIADTSNQRIRKVAGGIISTMAGNGAKTFAGDGGAATEASLNNPAGIVIDANNGNLFIADTSNQRIRRILRSDSSISTVAGNGDKAFAGDGGEATKASFNNPYGVAVDAQGNLYIADTNNQRIRKVTPIITVSFTKLESWLNPSTFGTPVTFTATVTGDNPQGSVSFMDGDNDISTCMYIALSTLLSNSKQAKCQISSLTAANHDITAIYASSNNYNTPSSDELTQVVNKGSTTIALASSKNPSAYGEQVTFTATVTGTLLNGTVKFKDSSAVIPNCDAAGVSKIKDVYQATCLTSTLGGGSHYITATYSGDDNNNASNPSSTLKQVVTLPSTTTNLSSSTSISSYGNPVTFTAKVTGFIPTGAIVFKEGTTSICSTVYLANATAACTTTGLSMGSHSITATYSGDAYNAGSTSSVVSLTVNAAGSPTTTTISSSASSSKYASAVTFTAKVSGMVPTGKVTFKTGAYVIPGCEAVPFSAWGTQYSTAVCTTNALNTGTHLITGVYSGDPAYTSSTSKGFSQIIQTINQSSTSTRLSSSQNPSMHGGAVAFTALVSSDGAPTGTAAFKDGGAFISGCNSVVLDNVGVGYRAKCSTTALSTGTHSITTVFGGDSKHTSSTSAVLTQKVSTGFASATSLTSSLNPSTYGDEVILTAKISGGTTPGGTVTFKDGSSTLAGCSALSVSNAKTVCTTRAINAGDRSITAVYSGDSNIDASTSPIYMQKVATTIDVTLTSPEDGDSFPSSLPLFLMAEASDTYAPIKKVAFYLNSTLVGTATSEPYSVISSSVLRSGSYTVKAIATDTAGQSWTSNTVKIVVCNDCYY